MQNLNYENICFGNYTDIEILKLMIIIIIIIDPQTKRYCFHILCP